MSRHGTPRFIVIMLAILLLGGLSVYRAASSETATRRHALATPFSHASAALSRLCGQAGWPESPVGHGAYVVQNDEWNSTAPECITTNGSPQFTVASSSIYEPASRDPGGYPSIFSGCSAGVCTAGNKMPIRVRDLRPGMVTSSWTTVQPQSGAYDVAYDIWFNRTPSTSGPPDGAELMIWLAHRGGSQIAPGGDPVAHVTIGGRAYTIWLWSGSPRSGQPHGQVSYVMDRSALSVQDLDLSAIIADAARRKYIAGSSYLLNVQAGFELWQGGAGLEAKSFTIYVGR
ncbi:MAG TPA: hypothetical protein VGH53_29720 [Streptosporangiaceae bacterium]